jgi:UDP-N-acetylglucosamine--N-acetylmuramyl-(pentapeptide) pyrophosphoryl-undecaprenol N-acetylglucosamine transferase
LPKRVLIAAGGTGGHFYPGLVLAQTLKARGWEPLMLLRREDPALATLEREGIAACEVPLRGMPRSLGLPLLGFSRDLVKSLRLVSRVVRDFQPAVVVGMGGYLTFPAVAAAARRGVPRAIHESNAVPGLANKAAAAFGAQLFWGLPPVCGKGTVVGTPIRQALWTRGDPAAARKELGLAPGKRTVLIFGGSQGARGLNRGAAAVLARFAKKAPGLQVLHLAGKTEGPDVEKLYAGMDAKVLPFLDRMELAYAASDLVLCRSGASTLAELAAQRAPAILVPFPAAAANHQEINARVLEKAGACRVVLEAELEARLAGLLEELLASPSGETARRALANSYSNLGLPAAQKAGETLADAVEQLGEKATNPRL